VAFPNSECREGETPGDKSHSIHNRRLARGGPAGGRACGGPADHGEAGGVRIDGDRLWDLKVNDGWFFKRVLIAAAFFAAIFNSRYNNFLIL